MLGRRRLEPEHVRVRRVRERALDHRLQPVAHLEEALGRPLAGHELAIAGIVVGRQQLRRQRVRACDQHRRHAAHVRGQTRGRQRADELAGRHDHLPAQVAAFLLGRELILEVHAGGARLDHRAHQLVGVQRPAEPCLGVGDDRREPVEVVFSLRPVDLVGTPKRVVDPAHDGRNRVHRVQRLVGIGRLAEVRVAGDLPAAEVDRLQAGLHLLHGLVARQRAERGDVRQLVHERPEALGSAPRERVLDRERPAQPEDVLRRVVATDPLPARRLPLACKPLGLQLDHLRHDRSLHSMCS